MQKVLINFLIFIILGAICDAYVGQANTNISIILTNTTIKVSNNILGEQTTNFNFSNFTEIRLNYSWTATFEYNFSGMNITVLNYTIIQNCTFSEEDMNEIKTLIREQSSNSTYEKEQAYYQMYYRCFSNLTICDSYKTTNEGYKTNYDTCNAIKNSYYDENLRWVNSYYLLNTTYNACILEKDNYSSQRWVWSGIVVIVLLIIYFIKTKWYPDYEKQGKLGTRKERPPSMNYAPKVEEVVEKISPPVLPPVLKQDKIPNIDEIEERK